MLKLASKLILLLMMAVSAIIVVHVIAILCMQRDVEDAYAIRPEVKYVFLGDSQVGCSIEEKEENRNKVLWGSATQVQSWLIRLRELDRRGHLANVEVVLCPFNCQTIAHQTKSVLKWGWYQDMPVSWRYRDLLPCGIIEMIAYSVSNARLPPKFHVSEKPPRGRPSISSQPESWRAAFFEKNDRFAESMDFSKSLVPGWEESLYSALLEMRRICYNKGIRFVVFRMPLLPRFENHISDEGVAATEKCAEVIKSLGIEYVNMDSVYGEDKFCDEAHMAEAGAADFSKALFHKILSKEN